MLPIIFVLASSPDLSGVECMVTKEAVPIIREFQRRQNAKPNFIEPENAEAFLRVLNEVEPRSDIKPHDGLLTLTLPNGAGLVFVLDGEKVCGPIMLLPDTMKEAVGEKS